MTNGSIASTLRSLAILAKGSWRELVKVFSPLWRFNAWKNVLTTSDVSVLSELASASKERHTGTEGLIQSLCAAF